MGDKIISANLMGSILMPHRHIVKDKPNKWHHGYAQNKPQYDTLSTLSSPSFLADNATRSAYPGKNSKRGIPGIMRSILDGKTMASKINITTSRFTGISLFHQFNHKHNPSHVVGRTEQDVLLILS